MLDSPKALLDAIRLGEDSRLELKSVVFKGEKISGPQRDDLGAEMSAMANARGGVIVLGIGDRRREVLGIPIDRLDAVERYVVEIAQDSIRPPLFCVVERLELPDENGRARPVIRVEIPESMFVHETRGRYFHRVGSARRAMPPEFLARLLQQRSQIIRFDQLPVEDAAFADLDPERIHRFWRPEERQDLKVQARKIGLAAPGRNEILRPTLAGLLLAARRLPAQFSYACIQAVAYRGRSVPDAVESSSWYQLDAKDIEGTLDTQIEEACRFVSRNQRVEARKTMGRIDLPQYDMSAVFEAVVNAVAHRDYSMYGTRIRLRLFSDRLELSVPGALSNTMTVAELEHRQRSRNEALVDLLARCPVPAGIPGLETQRMTIMDTRGDGVPLILARSEKLSGRRPKYELFGDELRLTIYAAGEDRGSS